MFWGPIMAAVGMSFIGLLPSYALFLPFLVFGGLGVFGNGVLAHNLGTDRAMGLLLYLPIAAHVLAFFLSGKNFFPNPQKNP